MSSRAAKAALDARVLARLKARGMTDVATIGSIQVEGYFTRDYVTQGGGDEAVGVVRCAFDCRADGLPTLEHDDEIEIEGEGEFRFLYREGPDDGGRVILVLGEMLEQLS